MNTMKRKMKVIDPCLLKVAYDMEYIIGSSCYSTNKTFSDEGHSFRYPVHIRDISKGDDWFYSKKYHDYNLNNAFEARREKWTPEDFSHIYYKFGSNELKIGKAILEILNYLENHFDIDFEELEKKHSI